MCGNDLATDFPYLMNEITVYANLNLGHMAH